MRRDSSSCSLRSRLLGLAAFVLAVASLVLAPAAGAQINGSRITTPRDPFQRSFDFSNGQGPFGLRIDGLTQRQVPGDKVDLRCFGVGNVASPVLGTLDVDSATSAFGGYIDAAGLAGLAGPCVLRALPAGIPVPSDLAPYAGVRVYPTAFTDARIASLASPNAGTRYDIFDHVVSPDRASHFALGALGGCGLYFARPLDLAGDPSAAAANVFNCADWADFTADGTPSSRSDIQVDGSDAFTGGMLANSQLPAGNGAVMAQLPGMPSLNVSRGLDASGNYALDEGSDVVRCRTPLSAFPPVNASVAQGCGALVASGVRYARRVDSSQGGRVVTITDHWSSTDGRAHRLDLLLEQDMQSESYGLNIPWVNGGDFSRWPGSASLPAAPRAPGTILVRSDAGRTDSVTAPVGAIVYGTAPDSVEFYDDGNEVSDFPQLHYVRDVPASGDLSLSFSYATGTSLGAVRALAAREEDRLGGPSVSLTAPSSTSVPQATVSGTAGDNGGVSGLTVNGAGVAVDAAGKWSTIVPLALGANTVTARAVDHQGNAAQASVNVTYTPPDASPNVPSAARGQCLVPSVVGLTVKSASAKLVKANCRLGQVVYGYVKPKHVRKGRRRLTVSFRRGRIVTQRVKPGSKVAGATAVRVHVQARKPVKKHARHRRS